MATYQVSNQSQLKSALNSAKGGDSVVLKSGNYGNLSISGEKYSSAVKITSESASNEASFSKISLTNVSNLTFDNIDLKGSTSGGYGLGTGMRISSSSNVTVQNSDFTSFHKGMEIWNNSNLKILNNKMSNLGYDGVVIGHSQGVLIQGNNISTHGHGDGHRDVIQFYNQGSKAPSGNITIKGNVLKSDDGITHGIYFGNNDTRGSNTGEFYKNISIEGNTVKTGHMLGIAIGGAQGVSIKNNVLVQSDDFSSKKTVNIPMLLIDEDARGVSLSGNTLVKAPGIADDGHNWTVIGTLSNNGGKVVGLGASVASAAAELVSTPSTGADALTTSDGADEFRFMGDKIGSGTTSAPAIDFSDGDTIVLNRYAADTFEDMNGGNAVLNNDTGSYVKIDSVTDLRELVSASEAITAEVSGDTLILDIEQARGDHRLELAGLGQAYQSDTTLF